MRERDARSLEDGQTVEAIQDTALCLFVVDTHAVGIELEAKVTKTEFGNMPDGTKVEIYTLEEGAIKARVMTYGARLVSLEVLDRTGKVADIVLGHESLAG